MKILISGARGFIGKHLTKRLSFDNDVDIEPKKRKKYDVFIHLAAFIDVQESFKNPLKYWENNVFDLKELLNYENVRIIYPSSFAIYNPYSVINPKSPYGATKYAAELFIRDCFKDYVILRLANVYGKGMHKGSLIRNCIEAKKKNEKIIINNTGKQKRDFIYISDVIDAFVLSLDCPKGIYEVCTGKGYTVKEVVDIVGCDFEYNKNEITEPHSVVGSNKLFIERWKPKISLKECIKLL